MTTAALRVDRAAWPTPRRHADSYAPPPAPLGSAWSLAHHRPHPAQIQGSVAAPEPRGPRPGLAGQRLELAPRPVRQRATCCRNYDGRVPPPQRATVAVRCRLWLGLTVVMVTLAAVGLHQLTLDYAYPAGAGHHDTVIRAEAPDVAVAHHQPVTTSTVDPTRDLLCIDGCGGTEIVVACLLVLTVLAGAWLLRLPILRRLPYRPPPLPLPLPADRTTPRRTALTLMELSLIRT